MAHRFAARQLTTRDRELLRWIGQAGIASEGQIHRRYWAGKRLGTAQDRLLQLRKAKLVEQHRCDVARPGETVYTLTRKGRLLFEQAERSRLHVGLPAAHEIKQQLVAQDAYIYLAAEVQAAGGTWGDWRSERELRSEFRQAQNAATAGGPSAPTWEIADAQAVWTDATGSVQIVDVEIDGQYYGKMLARKLARFGGSGRPTVWICDNPRRAANIARAAAAWPTIRVITV
ncbi:MAG: replication-relaxation family protein [Chloroflexota bacterium]|nr:replication-relaxation family protein [Chloroflexota bacterium]